MRATTIDEYGSADKLHVRELARPTCGQDQVLVHVCAAGVNPIDWRIRKDLQQIARMMADNKLRPVVQEVYPLEEAATAHRVSEAGHVRGKLVLSISGASVV